MNNLTRCQLAVKLNLNPTMPKYLLLWQIYYCTKLDTQRHWNRTKTSLNICSCGRYTIVLGLILTVIGIVQIYYPFPAVISDRIDDGLVVLRPHRKGEVHEAWRWRQYFLREPRRHERHLERVAVGVQSVEGIRRYCSQHRVHSSWELIADWKRIWVINSQMIKFRGRILLMYFRLYLIRKELPIVEQI